MKETTEHVLSEVEGVTEKKMSLCSQEKQKRPKRIRIRAFSIERLGEKQAIRKHI